jgi:oxygen-dependent protoporphyrinogen oxidase
MPDVFKRVAVLGGGITGLTTAHRLLRLGCEVVLFESSNRIGGSVSSVREGGWLVEEGPNTVMDSSKILREIIAETGLENRVLKASPVARHRFVVHHGRPVPLPGSPPAFLTTRLFPFRAKLRLLKEPFLPKGPADRDESVADFTRRRLGREFLDYAIDPFVSGIYAGDPEQLTVRAAFPKLHALEQEHGSLLRGALAKRNASGGPKGGIISFPEGLSELTRALEASCSDRIRLSSPVRKLQRAGVEWELDAAPGERFDAVACTLPPRALLQLSVQDKQTEFPFAKLDQVPHPVVASIFLGFRREEVAHPLNGFGLLAPAVEKRRILGVLFSSILFPGRAPEGHVALTVLTGGMRHPENALLEDAPLLEMVQKELGALLGVTGKPVYQHIRRWPAAIPQYASWVHSARATARALEFAMPGLYFGGQALDGVALPACVEAGAKLAMAAAGLRVSGDPKAR